MKGLLVRVGIDATDGAWNAPLRASTGEFAYVTITETKRLRPGLARYFEEFTPAVARFGLGLPPHLAGQRTHLDPDFDRLTYGDQGQRGRRISGLLGPGDLLAFFASLRSEKPAAKLVYALIGLYQIEAIVPAQDIGRALWTDNAHTRRIPGEGDVVVRARPDVSGRLRRCIPIGEYRERAYRVRADLLEAWGGLDIKNGYVQRSARLPAFHDAARFYRWFQQQEPELVRHNNPT